MSRRIDNPDQARLLQEAREREAKGVHLDGYGKPYTPRTARAPTNPPPPPAPRITAAITQPKGPTMSQYSHLPSAEQAKAIMRDEALASLTKEELAVARAMGIAPEAFARQKASLRISGHRK